MLTVARMKNLIMYVPLFPFRKISVKILSYMQQEALNSKSNDSVHKWRSSIRPQVNNLRVYHGPTLLGVATWHKSGRKTKRGEKQVASCLCYLAIRGYQGGGLLYSWPMKSQLTSSTPPSPQKKINTQIQPKFSKLVIS